MFRKYVRIAILPVIGILALLLAVMAIFGRFFRILIPVAVLIFVFARIASSDKNKKTEQEQPERGTGSTQSTESRTVDAEYTEKTVKTETTRFTNGMTGSFRRPDTADRSKVKESERAEYDQLMEHIRSISSSLYQICNMDIRNTGNRVQRLARDIIRERYVENNSCRGFSQYRNYYLPTLRKTVENYSMMERKGITDLRIRDDMLAYLRSCEEAFTRLYNSMFDDDIMNMEVQMKAMNITLKRDGLL